MAEIFGFSPDFWRQMPWSEFNAWQKLTHKRSIEEANRRRRNEFERTASDDL